MAYPSYSGPLKNPFNDMSNEDDEFGDFTSAVTFPTIGNHIVEVPKVQTNSHSVFFNPIPDSDDEFGDFCGPAVVVEPKAEENIIKKCQPNYDINLEEEDLTAVTQLSWLTLKETEEEEEEEEFTNFTSAEPIQDLFSSIVDQVDDILPPAEPKTDDEDFGDFTQAIEDTRPSPVEDLFILETVQPVCDEPEPTSEPQINWDDPLEPFSVSETKEEEETEAQEEEEEEFGDFTDFQTASNDEFDDFEAAPPPCCESTKEDQIQRVLMALFPTVDQKEQEQQIALTNSPGGGLWSYVSQLDSTPALSFSWRHSAAQQRFLHSLRIDSVSLHGGNNGGYRWTSPSSVHNSSSASTEESTVTLDLDFFLNPPETMSPGKGRTHLHLDSPTTTTQSVVDLLE